MKFFVSRSSDMDDHSKQPCEEAVSCFIVGKSTEGVDTSSMTQEQRSHILWYPPEVRMVRWTIEINSLEELMKFYAKYGDLVIRWEEHTKEPEICIYDYYLE